VAHAGEEGPPSYITGALDLLGAERIDHGVAAEQDDALVERLVREKVPLTMCPLSNLALRVVEDLREHNLKRLLDRGVRVTVNSDDPAYFGGYVTDNYLAIQQALDLDRADVVTLARNAIDATFLTADGKARLRDELASYAGSAVE
jgi:adenosine deaminase